MDIKVEVKDESCFLDFCSENEKELLTKKVKTESVTSDCDRHIHIKTEIEGETEASNLHSLNQREFSSNDPVVGYSKNEIDTKIEIKQEQWSLQTCSTEAACSYDIKDEDFPPVTSSRLRAEGVSSAVCGKPPLFGAESSAGDTSFYTRKDYPEYERQKIDVTEMLNVEHAPSEQSGKCSEGGEMYIRPLHLKLKTSIHKSKRPHTCKTCGKSFTRSSDLNKHNIIHEGKKPHHCKICDKNFTQLSSLNRHNLIHEGKKPHQCKTCNKSFTWLSDLNKHNLIHEGKKPHQCKTCDKSFTQLSHLKQHNLIHEGKKPHKCKTCAKSFTYLSNLKTHNLIHEGKKPHQCKTCDKSFTQLSSLKTHYLIHKNQK